MENLGHIHTGESPIGGQLAVGEGQVSPLDCIGHGALGVAAHRAAVAVAVQNTGVAVVGAPADGPGGPLDDTDGVLPGDGSRGEIALLPTPLTMPIEARVFTAWA